MLYVADDTSSFGLAHKKILKKITTFLRSIYPNKDSTIFPIFRKKIKKWMAIIMVVVVAMEVAEFLFYMEG